MARLAVGRLAVGRGVSWLLMLPQVTSAQRCAEPHYRWSEKVDTALATRRKTPVVISEILTGWAPPSITSKDACAPRAGREDSVFVVTGWVPRMRPQETDGDWHIELTEAATTPVTSCIIAEIPAETYGVIYRRARRELAALVDTTQLSPSGDVDPPVRVQLTGAAFYDGYHQKQPTGGGASHPLPPRRCNSSLRAPLGVQPVDRGNPRSFLLPMGGRSVSPPAPATSSTGLSLA